MPPYDASDSDTSQSTTVSPGTIVRMPIAVLGSLIGLLAVGYAAWTAKGEKDHQQDRHFEATDSRVSALEADQRTTREMLIRIDANVENIRRDQRANRSLSLP